MAKFAFYYFTTTVCLAEEQWLLPMPAPGGLQQLDAGLCCFAWSGGTAPREAWAPCIGQLSITAELLMPTEEVTAPTWVRVVRETVKDPPEMPPGAGTWADAPRVSPGRTGCL